MEYGGYLPLELYRGQEYFDDIPEEYIAKYNTGRTALYAAIISFGAKRVWLPYYYCPSVWEMLRNNVEEIELIGYYLDSYLEPLNIDLRDDDVLILVNYFGIMNHQIDTYVADKQQVIIDNAQAFFNPPILRPGILNIYSCRKFIGVSDGAYLIGKDQLKFNFEQDQSWMRSQYLARSIEEGTNSGYQDSLKNETLIGEQFLQMSKLTKKILCGADYEYIKKRRKENFSFVHSYFKGMQRLQIAEIASAYCYPLLLDCDIREQLIESNIYIPTLWKELITPHFQGKLEYNLSKNMVCFPIDQRYGIDEMKEICGVVENVLKGAAAC